MADDDPTPPSDTPPDPAPAPVAPPPAAPPPAPLDVPITLRSAAPWLIAGAAVLLALLVTGVAVMLAFSESAVWRREIPVPGHPTPYAFTIAVVVTALLSAGFGYAIAYALTSLKRAIRGPSGDPTSPIPWEPTPEERERVLNAYLLMRSPLTMLTAAILLAVMLVFLANLVVPGNANLLNRLDDPEYARGIITYLFSVGTIGVILIVVYANLSGQLKNEQYENAKTFVSLLLGLFGTIVGFYYGQASSADNTAPVEVAELQTTGIAGDSLASVAMMGRVFGGTSPYSVTARLPNGAPIVLPLDGSNNFSDTLEVDGGPPAGGDVTIGFEVRDVDGHAYRTERVVELPPIGGAPVDDGDASPDTTGDAGGAGPPGDGEN